MLVKWLNFFLYSVIFWCSFSIFRKWISDSCYHIWPHICFHWRYLFYKLFI